MKSSGRTRNSCRVAVLLGDKSNPFWTGMVKEYEFLAPIMGIDVACFFAEPEKNREAQLKKLLEILRRGFDAVIINPISNRNLVAGILKAAENEIPILDVGAKTDQESIKEAGCLYHPVQTVDFFAQGFMAGNYLCQRLLYSGGGKVVIIEGRADSTQSIGRSAGAAQAFTATTAVHLVCRENADFDRSKAAIVSRSILEKEPGIKAFFCANDVMALGVADAVRALSPHPDVTIVGVDLTPESRSAIRQGYIAASVAFSPKVVAQVVFGAVKHVIVGEELEKGFPVTSIVIDRDNIDTYTD
jgi:ABC-type sugar transport system substrate-binding protein